MPLPGAAAAAAAEWICSLGEHAQTVRDIKKSYKTDPPQLGVGPSDEHILTLKERFSGLKLYVLRPKMGYFGVFRDQGQTLRDMKKCYYTDPPQL